MPKKEKIKIYLIYRVDLADALEITLESHCQDKEFEVREYYSISDFQMAREQNGWETGNIMVVHLSQNSDKANPEDLNNFVADIRQRWPFCRIGIQSGAYKYTTNGIPKMATAEEVLKDSLPDFYFESMDVDGKFLISQLIKGPLSLEEILWRNEGHIMTPKVEIGPGGRPTKRERE